MKGRGTVSLILGIYSSSEGMMLTGSSNISPNTFNGMIFFHLYSYLHEKQGLLSVVDIWANRGLHSSKKNAPIATQPVSSGKGIEIVFFSKSRVLAT